MKYSMHIRWSDEDQVFVVHLPEFDCYTHGETYLEAVQMGQEALDLLIEDMSENHQALPVPNRFQSDEIYRGNL
jgi:predicted RNase H-like HicB family nuclease